MSEERKAAMDRLIAEDADLIDPVRDERQETIKLCLRNAIDWESVGNHKAAAFWRNVASEIQTVEALTAEVERLRAALAEAAKDIAWCAEGLTSPWAEHALKAEAKARAALGDTQ